MNKIVVLFFLLAGTPLWALSPWAQSFGSHSPYATETYYTGFGMSSRSGEDAQTLEQAKSQASAALVNQIQVHIKSEQVLTSLSTEDSESSEMKQTVSQLSEMDIPGIRFEIDKDKKNFYVLAWVEKASLLLYWQKQAKVELGQLSSSYNEASVREKKGNRIEAYESYSRILPRFTRIYRILTLYSGAGGETKELLLGSNFTSVEELVSTEQRVRGQIESLRSDSLDNFEQIFYFLADQLKLQGVTATSVKMAPLTFRDSDFSSPFGRYCSERLLSEIPRRLSSGKTGLVLQGHYSDQGDPDSIEIALLARTESGALVGSAFVRCPRKMIPPGLEMKPENWEQALSDRYDLDSQAFSDGSIHVELWTDKGLGEESVVFSHGEPIQFYFRVNQPSFLRLTYVLVTGQKVLLESSFYIGTDQVNRVVAYPARFTPTPPYGVERVIVTASSTAPPPADVYPEKVDGEIYDVFRDYSSLFGATRGIQRITPEGDKPSVGEASLTMTTTP